MHLEGIGASVGEHEGTVAVMYTAPSNGDKLPEKGFVLVAPMTTPDYVPAMREAGAIVTDQGGITCHAAIVAREFGIPCVVAAHNATATLLTGQVVQVVVNRQTGEASVTLAT